MLIKKIMVSLLSLSLVVFFASCSKSGTMVERGIKEQILYIGNQVEPEDLDPHIITGVQEYHIVTTLLEGLVNLDPVDLHPVAGAARSWDISPDNMTYTFHLRSNGKWSNGDPVRASDFVFSFKRILTKSIASEYSYMLYPLHNGEAFNNEKITDFNQVGAEAIDDTTLRITLEKPVPYFLSLLAHHSWFPVNPSVIAKFGATDKRGTQWTRAGNYVGNGPFVLTKWDINREIAVTKNSNYWDNGTVKLKEIHFYPIENNQTEERSFKTGQLTITSNCPLDKIEWYKKNEPNILRMDPYLGTYFYIVNVNKGPLADPLIRKALAFSIDRKALVERVLKGGQAPATCFTPINTAGYTCTTSIGFDTTAARKLLAEAGYGSSKPFPKISLLYNTSEQHQKVAEAIQQMWRQYLGIDVELVNQEWKVYLNSKKTQDYEVARMGWIGDYNDPATFLDVWLTKGGNNNTGWSNKPYDSLIAAASQTKDQKQRYDVFQEAEKILLDQLPILPIYFYTNVYLINPAVKNWNPNVLNYHPFKYVFLEK